MAWTEIPWRRTAWSRVFQDGSRRACIAHLGAIHWERGPQDWALLDLALQRESGLWAVRQNDYEVRVEDGGWIAVGPWRGEIWLRWRVARAGFLHWPTRTVQALGGDPTYDPGAVTTETRTLELPLTGEIATVESGLLWPGLWSMPGEGRVDLRLRLVGQRLKTELVLNQAGRDWLAANLPEWPAAETFLGFALQVDWSGIPRVTQGSDLKAEFSGAPRSGTAPLDVNFTNESSGSPTRWAWDFGNGATSNEQHPVHRYTEPGKYTVRLTVDDIDPTTQDFSDEAGPLELRRIPPTPGEGDNPRWWRFRELVGLLPVGKVYVAGADDPGVPLVRRFWPDAGEGWAFAGQRLPLLGGLPAGDAVFDPTVDVSVGAGADDGRRYSDGAFSNLTTTPYVGYRDDTGYASCHHYYRWTGVTIDGTVDTAWVKIRSNDVSASSGSPELAFYGVDEDNPAAPTTAAEFDGDPLTTSKTDWDTAWSNDAWQQSPELKEVFQELADSYDISADAVMLQLKNDKAGTANNWNRAVHYDAGAEHAAQLHIEYNVGPQIYALDFEEGDESDLDGVVETANTYVDVSSDAALAGSDFGLKTTLNLTADLGYGYRALSAPATDMLRVSGRLNFNSLSMVEGTSNSALQVDGASSWLVQMYLRKYSGYNLRFYVRDDALSSYNFTSAALSGTAEHQFAIELQRATGSATNDGVFKCWVGGALVGSKTNLDNYDLFPTINELDVGCPYGGNNQAEGNFYLDEIGVYRSGTDYEKALAGQLYAMGEMGRAITKAILAALSSAGIAQPFSTFAVAGVLNFSKALLGQPGKVLGGALDTAAGLSWFTTKVLAGEVWPSGARTVQPGKVLAGALDLAGVMIKLATVGQQISGMFWVEDLTATLVKEPQRSFSGRVASAGAVVKQFQNAGFTAALDAAGALVRQPVKALAGAIAAVDLAGIASGGPVILKDLIGALGAGGALVRQVGKAMLVKGSLGPTGKTTKQASPASYTGSFGFGKALARTPGKLVQGALSYTSAMVRDVTALVEGVIAPQGALPKEVQRAVQGAFDPAGVLQGGWAFLRDLVGAITPGGDITRYLPRSLSGRIKPAGATVKQPARSIAGSVSGAGALRGRAEKALAGVLDYGGALVGRAGKVLAGALNPASTLQRDIAHLIGAALTPTGQAVKQAARALASFLDPEREDLTATVILSRYWPAFNLGVMRVKAATLRVRQSLAATLGIRREQDGS